ncbi:MAG: GNAT family N-acetyltransferase [Anaerolineales bacterium]|nr:GNAT family N-acetyltransferase [Chloroflexota bacterium]MBL6980084.1 GNAT family N-acetyltransferase [Anaerolineales bacterium]
MAAIPTTLLTSKQKNLRPFDTRRDLMPAADLIELCFAETLSVDGRRYLQKMRATAKAQASSQFAALTATRASLPLAGYVWEEDGQLVGNLSLIPFFHRGRRINLIANVSVHPDYRQNGIAKALTQEALDKSRRRRISEVWLQVREDNPAACALYNSMGFKAQGRRSTWTVNPKCLRGEIPPGRRVTIRSARHWEQQTAWLLENYPASMHWHFPLNMQAIRPGLLGLTYRFFSEVRVRQWVAREKDNLLGVLIWQASHAHADYLWFAASPETEEMAIYTIMPFIKRESLLRRPLSLDYPAGRAEAALLAVGFEFQHTLIWMKVKP